MKVNKVLVYDDSCPLCAAYTRAFVKAGFLSKEERKAFSAIDNELLLSVSMQKGRNEIPLIDIQTKQVWYGIDALLEILDRKIPFIKSIGNTKPVKFLLRKLYKLISYNRRVIVAPAAKPVSCDCTPDFNSKYRLAFMLFFLLFNTAMLFPVHRYVIQNSFLANAAIMQLQTAHFLLVAGNILLAVSIGGKKGVEYIGQVNMLALTVILLLLPLVMINKCSSVANSFFNNVYLVILTFFITGEYIRRIRFAGVLPEKKWVVFINVFCLLLFFTYLIM
jgi:predicted DCC family thiol-disulfide oxidoreductase YuxK